jgi:flavin reductase (DIM6/NTAB) family NADH-FMN oxidoreductase RutF
MPAMATPEAESKRFRDVIGRFATGVTVITLCDDDQPVGITANAVSSLSLDPLLILFCVDKGASAHDAIASAEGFAINLLALEQRDVSGFFATSGRGEDGDAMGGFSFREGTTGAPLLEGTLGWFDCRPSARSWTSNFRSRMAIHCSSSVAATANSPRPANHLTEPRRVDRARVGSM